MRGILSEEFLLNYLSGRSLRRNHRCILYARGGCGSPSRGGGEGLERGIEAPEEGSKDESEDIRPLDPLRFTVRKMRMCVCVQCRICRPRVYLSLCNIR